MIEKKDPHQKITEDDFFDDDPIIELTDEVIIKPEEHSKPASPKTDDFIPPKADQDLSFDDEDDEDVIVFDENANLLAQDDPFSEADGQITDDAIEMTGDETLNIFNDDIELEYENDGEEIDFFADQVYAHNGRNRTSRRCRKCHQADFSRFTVCEGQS